MRRRLQARTEGGKAGAEEEESGGLREAHFGAVEQDERTDGEQTVVTGIVYARSKITFITSLRPQLPQG